MKYILKVILFAVLLFKGADASAQLMGTKLEVTVLDYLGNLVEGASVTLYRTQADYENEENEVQVMVTDEKGEVLFRDMEPVTYFMLVTKGDLSNIGGGVQTSKLIAKKKNMLNVVIE